MKTSFKLVIFSFIFLSFLSCRDEPIESNEPIFSENFRISTESTIHYYNGVIYKDQYLVWSRSEDGIRLLESYDLISKKKKWEYSFDGIICHDENMYVYKDYVIAENIDLGFIVFNIPDQELIIEHRYDVTYINSNYPITISNDKIYKSLYSIDFEKSYIYSFDINTGKKKLEYSWQEDDQYDNHLSSPSLYYNPDKGQYDKIMVLHQKNKRDNPIEYQSTFLISIDEDNSLNWIDTIDQVNHNPIYAQVPTLIDDRVYFAIENDFIDYKANTGERNHIKLLNENHAPTLIAKGKVLYLNGAEDFKKYLIENQTFDWEVTYTYFLKPHRIRSFEVVDSKILYVYTLFNSIGIINDQNGQKIGNSNTSLNNVANPTYSEEHEFFVTHTKDQIITFTISD